MQGPRGTQDVLKKYSRAAGDRSQVKNIDIVCRVKKQTGQDKKGLDHVLVFSICPSWHFQICFAEVAHRRPRRPP